MKRPQPDLGGVMLQRYINNVGSVRKLLRLWGTTTVEGVEVDETSPALSLSN